MPEPVFQKMQLVGTSPKSFSEAAANAVAKAVQMGHRVSWFEVDEQRGAVVNGAIEQFQVTVTVGFKLD
jgi:hypothetical protein